MKANNLFASLFAIALLSSCTQQEIFTEPEDNTPKPIQLAPMVNKQTKALPIDGNTIGTEGRSLVLKGYYTKEDKFENFTAKPESWIDGTLTYRGTKWETDMTYYWPSNKKSNLSFFSYYPAMNGAGNTEKINFVDPAGFAGGVITYPSFQYTVSEDIVNQNDLIVAAAINQTAEVNAVPDKGVDLAYKHLLAQVYFKAKTDVNSYKAKISSITLKGVKNTGKFTFNATESVGTWSNISGEGKHIYRNNGLTSKFYTDVAAENVLPNGTAEQANGTLMILPQAANENLILEVVYSLYNDKDIILADIKKTAHMESIERGKKYAYTLILTKDDSMSEIKFNVTADDWENDILNTIKFDAYAFVKDDVADATANAATNAAAIQGKVLAFANEMNRAANEKTGAYTHTISIYSKGTNILEAPMTIDLSGLDALKATDLPDAAALDKIPVGSKIILDLEGMLEINATNKITVTLAQGSTWAVSAASLDKPGKITITKKSNKQPQP